MEHNKFKINYDTHTLEITDKNGNKLVINTIDYNNAVDHNASNIMTKEVHYEKGPIYDNYGMPLIDPIDFSAYDPKIIIDDLHTSHEGYYTCQSYYMNSYVGLEVHSDQDFDLSVLEGYGSILLIDLLLESQSNGSGIREGFYELGGGWQMD